jgi:hypothetical protein
MQADLKKLQDMHGPLKTQLDTQKNKKEEKAVAELQENTSQLTSSLQTLGE